MIVKVGVGHKWKYYILIDKDTNEEISCCVYADDVKGMYITFKLDAPTVRYFINYGNIKLIKVKGGKI